MTSNPTYWTKIGALFDVLQKVEGISSSQQIDWITNGLVVGAKKEMRQSAYTAYTVSYCLLMDVIAGIEEPKARETAWKTNFLEFFLRYFPSDARNPYLEPVYHAVLIEVFVRMKNKSPTLFNEIWLEGCNYNTMMVFHFRDEKKANRGEWDFRNWINLTLPLLHRLLEGSVAGDNTVKTETLDPAVITFLHNTSLYFAYIVRHMQRDHPGGDWPEAMEFFAYMMEDPLFSDCLVHVDSMASGLKAFKEYIAQTPAKMDAILRWGPFLRVAIVFCRLFSAEGQAIWQSIVDTTTSTGKLHGFIRNSVIGEIVTILKPSYTYLKVAPGVNESFAREAAKVLNENKDPESDEGKRLIELFVSIVSFRGTYVTQRSLSIGILVSNETAVAMVQNLGTDSKVLVPIIVKLCARDPRFIEHLLWSDHPESQTETGNEAKYNAAAWVQSLYEQQSRDR